jgi:CDP-diacylglycerol--glycerol-3-phosphate 3-phosphatidyltransferase
MIPFIKKLLTKKNIPLLLTLSRIIISILILFPATLQYGQSSFLGCLFLILGLTDLCDGIFARYYNVESYIGSLLDPLADKILILSALLPLSIKGIIPAYFLYCFLLRDMTVMVVREFSQKKGIQVKPSSAGKWKTALLMISIVLTYMGYFHLALFFTTLLLSCFSAYEYIIQSKIL